MFCEGLRFGAGGIDYSASKAAVINMVQVAANQLAGTNIRVNALLPVWFFICSTCFDLLHFSHSCSVQGLTETGMTHIVFDRARERGTSNKIGQLNPLRRAAVPEEMATVALFLASSDSSYVNGQSITACGGLSSSHPIKLGSGDAALVYPEGK